MRPQVPLASDADLPAERHSIIPIACLRLSRMRLKATESAVISTDGVMDESVVTGRPGQ